MNPTAAYETLRQGVSSVDLTTPSWDVFVLLFFLIGVFLYGIALGRNRLIIVLISLYFSYAIFTLSEMIRNTGLLLFRHSDFAPLLTFLALLILTFLVIGQSHAARALSHESTGAFWQTIVFSVLQVGLTTSLALSLLPPLMQLRFSMFLRQVFIDPWGVMLWAVLPIVFLAFARMTARASSFR